MDVHIVAMDGRGVVVETCIDSVHADLEGALSQVHLAISRNPNDWVEVFPALGVSREWVRKNGDRIWITTRAVNQKKG